MADERTTRPSSADERAKLRRRVAELERANERLSRQLQRTRGRSDHTFLENINDIVYTTDLAGNLVFVNPAVRTVLGFDPQEVIGTHYGRWLSREDFERLEAARPEVLQGRRRTNRAVLHDRGGEGHQVEISVGPLVIEGRVEGTQGIIRDITAQQHAEEEIRRLQRQIEFVLGATKTGLNITDKEFNLRFVDANWCRCYGPYQGRKCYEYFHDADRPCPECGIPKALQTKQVVVYESLLPKEGNRPIQVSTIPFQGENGEWLVAELNIDIAERQQLERQFRESEERYRTVVETAGEAIAVVDAQGVFRFMNATAGRRLGGQPADFVGQTMWELFPRDAAEAQMMHIHTVIESGQGQNVVALTNVCGELRWYNTTVEPLRDAAGHIVAGLVIARDIHELRTAQEELETYREKMMRAEHLASLGTLSAMLSHEMMQPLTVIRLSIQNALETLAVASVPPTVREDLNDGLAGVSDAAAIVGQFRDFARRTSDKKVERVSLAVVARRVVRLLEEGARKARIVLDVGQLDELPALYANGKDVEQVFFALTQNAVQAADGARDHSFRVVGACRGDSVELQFADNCGGIAPEIVDHVFDPFVTTKPAGEGTGLGLCVVHRIVSRAGGRMTVDSRWGEGTTFFVTLPIGPAKTQGPTPTRSPAAQRPSGPGAGREGATP